MSPTRARRARGMIRPAAAVLTAMLVFVAPSAAHAAPTIADRQKWYFDLLKIPEAQRISTGEGVVVAVIDSGVDPSHPDLQGQVLPGKGVNGEASDGRSDRTSGHGTAMAGAIAGTGGGPNRMTGIAPGVRILPYALGADEGMERAAAGIRWAAENGAKVINLSWGGGTVTPPYLAEAVDYALSKDVVVVAAAGNRSDGESEVITPARIPGVIGVTGIDSSGAFWDAQSTQGRGAVLSAPAQDIVGAQPPARSQSGYALGGGTSSAAAIVSGVAAMVRAKFPDLNAANVIERLIRTADDRGPKGWDGEYGDGIVDPVAALTEDVPAVDRNPLLPDAPDTAGTAAASAPEDGSGTGNRTTLLVVGGLCLLGAVLALVAIVAAVSRARRRPGPPVPVGAPGPYPPPGPYPHQGHHPGYPPPQQRPPGYPPPQQYPPPGPPYHR